MRPRTSPRGRRWPRPPSRRRRTGGVERGTDPDQLGDGGRQATQRIDAEVDGDEEPPPAGDRVDGDAEPTVRRHEQDGAERRECPEVDGDGQCRGRAQVTQHGLGEECTDADQRHHEPTGHPLDRDGPRTQRSGWCVEVASEPGRRAMTSPPNAVGSTFEMNCPDRKWLNRRRKPGPGRIAVSTRCHRRVDDQRVGRRHRDGRSGEPPRRVRVPVGPEIGPLYVRKAPHQHAQHDRAEQHPNEQGDERRSASRFGASALAAVCSLIESVSQPTPGAAGPIEALPLPPMEQTTYEAAGLQMAALVAGEGGTPGCPVHGFTGCKEDFVDEVDPARCSGITSSPPTCGATARPTSRSTSPTTASSCSPTTSSPSPACSVGPASISSATRWAA